MNTPHGWQLHPKLAEDTHPVAHLGLSELRLMDDAHHPWLILVPRVIDARELTDLRPSDRATLTREIDVCSRALLALFKPDKLNVAALGNVVDQLHVHVIARFRNDIAWPRPVWGTASASAYTPESLVDRINALRDALDA